MGIPSPPAPKHDTIRQTRVRAAVRMASSCPVIDRALDGLHLRGRQGVLLPAYRSQLVVIASPDGSAKHFLGVRLPAVSSSGHGRWRRRWICAVQPFPYRQLPALEGGHSALWRGSVCSTLRGQNHHAAVFHRRRSRRISLALPPHIQPVDRTHGGAAGVLGVLLALLQRHDGR